MNPINLAKNMGSPEHSPHERPAHEADSPLQNAIRWFREKVAGKPEGTLKEMIAEALAEEDQGDVTISDDEKLLLKNMIHFGELTVRDIMVPRTDILAVSIDSDFDEWKRYVVDIGHTRIPVFEESLDKILGFVHVKDLFNHIATNTGFEVTRVMREILFVPPSMRIVDLLMKMRVSGCHIAIVVDEYGGTDGLVTMEDLFEELVGEIQDEHDGSPLRMMHWLGDNVLEADARAKIEDVEEALGVQLSDGIDHESDYDTLAGYIFAHLGRIPARGEVIKLSASLKLEIIAADPTRIRQVRLTRLST